MKSISFSGKTEKTLHVEVPGAIINITVGLQNGDGQNVTHVEIIADRYAGEEWHMPDYEDEQNPRVQSLNVRIVEVVNQTAR